MVRYSPIIHIFVFRLKMEHRFLHQAAPPRYDTSSALLDAFHVDADNELNFVSRK